MVFRGKKGERRGSWALRARSEYNNQNEAHSQSIHGCMNLHSWLVVSGEDPFPGLTLWDNISPQLLKQGASHSSISLWACLQQISQVCVCACACVRACAFGFQCICVNLCAHPTLLQQHTLFQPITGCRDNSEVKGCSTSIMARKQMNAVIPALLIKR